MYHLCIGLNSLMLKAPLATYRAYSRHTILNQKSIKRGWQKSDLFFELKKSIYEQFWFVGKDYKADTVDARFCKTFRFIIDFLI